MEPLGATTVFLAVCVSCLLFLSAWRKMSGSGKLPPGPVAFPIIGNTLQLNTRNLPQSIQEVRGISPYAGLWLTWFFVCFPLVKLI
uniref:Cytochrome P450 family 2 subfamily C member 8 n=1 Tax=Gopherus agassizii TaxID=38772 RepID=A0A452GPB9_9SAUR